MWLFQRFKKIEHTARVLNWNAEKIILIRIKDLKHLFKQMRKMLRIPMDESFTKRFVEFSEIVDREKCNSGLLLIQSTSSSFCRKRILTSASGA